MMEEKEKKDLYILGIESSCDETAAAVVKNGRQVLSNVISSQIDIHTIYGGVVPEIASRLHCENINGVIRLALKEAGMDFSGIACLRLASLCRKALPKARLFTGGRPNPLPAGQKAGFPSYVMLRNSFFI